LYAEMVQGRQILKFYTTMVHIANDCGYKILRFWANPQKYQTLVPAKNSHLKSTQICTCIFAELLTRETHGTDKASLDERVVAETGGSVVDLHQSGRGQVIPQRLIREKHPLT
jgi:GTP cyclohydrolase II